MATPIAEMIAFVRGKAKEQRDHQKWRLESAKDWRAVSAKDWREAKHLTRQMTGRPPDPAPSDTRQGRLRNASMDERIALKNGREAAMYDEVADMLERFQAEGQP